MLKLTETIGFVKDRVRKTHSIIYSLQTASPNPFLWHIHMDFRKSGRQKNKHMICKSDPNHILEVV